MQNIETLLSGLTTLSSIAALEEYTKKYIPPTYHKKGAKYPRLPFQLKADKIQQLKDDGWIDKASNKLIPQRFAQADAITQLLFSIIWKQGDLLKVARVVDGIVGKVASKSSDRITFLEFGRYLRDPEQEVIIDQHVIRAYQIIAHFESEQTLPDVASMKAIVAKDAIKESDRELVENFQKWVGESPSFRQLQSEPDWRYAVDDFLFAFGKMAKGKWRDGVIT